MVFFDWSDNLLIGVPQFDDHHRHLVGLLNKVYDDIASGADRSRLEPVFKELNDYVAYHFSAEENWMKSVNYPGMSQHIQEHAEFSKEILDIQEGFFKGQAVSAFELMNFLQDWLLRHILKTDAKYGAFIASKR